MTKRPLIRTEPVSEFGEFEAADLDAFADDRAMDNTYVPGWSDLRHRRDLELAEVAQGTRRPEDVSPLPVNVRMVRRTSAGGQFDGKKLMAAQNNGYRPITTEDVGEDWFSDMPPGSKVLEDGSIVNAAGDLQYMYVPGPRAAVNLQRKKQRMLDMAAMAGEKVAGGALENNGGTFGKEPLD
jgi:hypothetical protein